MKSLAIIGSGIAGMACAYFLRNLYKISLYEKNNYIGGHTNTVSVLEGASKIPVDTGFMVYNEITYPNLVRFFDHLEVEPQNTSMSFSINHVADNFEASFSDLRTFFPAVTDWVQPSRYRLLFGLKRLFAAANTFLKEENESAFSLLEFLKVYRIDSITTEKFLLPMTAAIWSTPHDRMLDYPAATLFRFLKNHGMLGFSEQFQWKTLKGGSQQYKAKVLEKIGPATRTNTQVSKIARTQDGVTVFDAAGGRSEFDVAIVATHADQALELLDSPTPDEKRLLSAFGYNQNPVVLHSDESVMPKKARAWASWNYRYDSSEGKPKGSTHYWMNRLQGVSKSCNYFVSVDYDGDLDPRKIHWKTTYEHPRFDESAIAAQAQLPQLNSNGSIYFCGSYFRYGFHEDAFTSALNVVKTLNGGRDPLS